MYNSHQIHAFIERRVFMRKKLFIIFECILLNFLLYGCSNIQYSVLQIKEKEQIEQPTGSEVESTGDAVKLFTSNITDMNSSFDFYIQSDGIDANEVTNAISRKINYSKKTYDLCNVKGCTMQTYRHDDYSEITVNVRYYMSREEYEYVNRRINELGPKLQGESDYQTYKNVFEWICTNVQYDYDTAAGDAEHFSAYDGLINKKAVCYGYAALFQKFCDYYGLECMVLTSMDDTAHAWNVVKLNNQYYHVDTTFGAGNNNDEILWQFFLCGQDRIRYGNAYGITLAQTSYEEP